MFIFKRGKFYHIEFFDENENKIKRVSTKCLTKKDALSFLTDFKSHLLNHHKNKCIYLKDFRDEYLHHIKTNFSKSYYITVDVSFKLFLNELGNLSLKDITYKMADQFITKTFNRTKEGARTYLIALKSAFNKAIKWRYLDENILARINIPRIPKHLPVVISHFELMQIVQNTSNRDLRDIYLTAFHTGMRLSEIINLMWDAIDLNERKLIVKNSENFTTKSKTERVIPINETMFRMLATRTKNKSTLRPSQYVFSKCDGTIFLKDYVSKNFKKVIRKLNMNEKIHFHSLRHSFASALVSNGVSLYIVKELLGHQDFSSTQIYSHLQSETIIEAIKVLD